MNESPKVESESDELYSFDEPMPRKEDLTVDMKKDAYQRYLKVINDYLDNEPDDWFDDLYESVRIEVEQERA